MDSGKRLLTRASGRWPVVMTLTLGMVLLFVLVQAMAWFAGGGTAVAFAQQDPDVITPTLTLEQALDRYIAAHIIRGDVMPTTPVQEGATPSGSAGTADYAVELGGTNSGMGLPGELITYTLTLSNTGTFTDVYDLTSGLADWAVNIPTAVFTLTGETAVTVHVTVQIPGNADEGDSDTTSITAQSRNDAAVHDSMTLMTTVALDKQYLPILVKTFIPPIPPTPVLSASRPNSANDWQMNWTISNNAYVTGYQLQQSQDPTFMTGVTTLTPGSSALSQLIDINEPSANNVYLYRIRALGTEPSPWSNVVQVIGAYVDYFNNNQTGWSGPTLKEGLRRLTFLERIDTWYENNDWLIIRVEDSWDWAIASPLRPAPQPPYAIEFRSKPANLGNLVSHGIVFGGNWTGAPCPDWTTYEGLYAHQNCFNHFYNTNLIWSSESDLTLLWERIDELIWCPSCGGSPLKRLGDVPPAVPFHPNASDWNDYRIEVRPNEIKFIMNGEPRFTYNDTRWINDPYFGVFASTDEYSNSTWRYEYFKVTPLDN